MPDQMTLHSENAALLEKPEDACEFSNCMQPNSVTRTTKIIENGIITSSTSTYNNGHCRFKVSKLHGCGRKYCADHAGKDNGVAKKNCCKECWDSKNIDIIYRVNVIKRWKLCKCITAFILDVLIFTGFVISLLTGPMWLAWVLMTIFIVY